MGQIDVKQYSKLKANGQIELQPYGDEVVVIQHIYDQVTGKKMDIPAMINVKALKQEQSNRQTQVDAINAEKANLDELVADIDALKAVK